MTGNTKYLDRARAAYQAFNRWVKKGVAYDGIESGMSILRRVPFCESNTFVVVNVTDSESFNNMESFWLAEVLKYLYLTFDDPSHISLDECTSYSS
jgi:mannosyl-oligosaccharide alpha-1,2-mannosidase